MIRYFVNIFKHNRNNYSEIELFFRAMKSFRYHKARCTSCGAIGHLSAHDFYERDLIIYSHGIHIHKIKIQRYICESCGHSHAIIPDMLIPYASYSLGCILAALRSYIFRSLCNHTVSDVCDRYQIAVSTLYSWKKRFLSHKSLWLGAAANIAVADADFLPEYPFCTELLSGFFRRFGFSFMQNHLASNSSVP